MGKSALKRKRQRPDAAAPPPRSPQPLTKKQRKQLKRQAADDDEVDTALDDDELRELSRLGFDDALAAGRAFEQMASFSGAIAAFQAAVTARPTDLRALGHLADAYAASAQHDAALETYTRALAAAPDADADASLWFRRGLAHLALAQHAGADASFRKALALSAAAMDAGDDGAAAATSTEANEEHMKAYSVTLAALANCYGEQGDVDSAVVLYRDAAAAFPANADLHYNLATMLMAKGDAPKQVLASLARAIACSPETPAFYEDAIAFAEAAGGAELLAKAAEWKRQLGELVAANAQATAAEASESDGDAEDDASGASDTSDTSDNDDADDNDDEKADD
ncbi:hypothetical protein PybrP1_001798 [[Pythium] brassicae (nom. inval.)]|nr:hypothetical protein PybrP1_001798 [[Pythium] brassicae (nom. inval.)]